MLPEIKDIRGLHPGIILEREFRLRGIRKSAFALDIGVYPGIITDITKERRGMNASLSIKIEKALDAEEGYFMIIQAYYEIEREKKKKIHEITEPKHPLLRKVLFWDVNFDKIDFIVRKRFVIERVFERGNKEEIEGIISFYGKRECSLIIKSARRLNESGIINSERYLGLLKGDLKCLKT
jgi:antitoxin HigA-1